ncbi:MAG TPA: DUF87 domain-containing protein [Candidatus Atribacteria bacterium]|nr:DUF87 domain-containing protein [Candidatus Atribacteria bacterium]
MENIISLYEKLGLFYFGKEVDPKTLETTDNLLLYKSNNFTTHAVIIGMTGSGKTGLGIGIIEEATLDKIPSIIIDPKGDMGNLLLAFPDLKSEDFEAWIDPEEAQNKGMDPKNYAAEVASSWENGLKSFYQDKSRIKLYKDNADFTIYTPGSLTGIPLSVLSSFDVPSEDILDDPDTFSSIINSTVMGLLTLINIKADPLSSKEYMLLATIFSYFWKKKKSLSLEELIGYIVNPPFEKVGVLNLKIFYPQNERLKLAMLLNNVMASPGFSMWTEGDALDIQKLLYTREGNPRVSILSLAHLDTAQRMFFLTLFLNKYISWMRQQRGTPSLRTILYMDEIFGFFPATSNPPSKKPMLILLKQARAYGVGVVLATQNPVDLDYKGLSNIGSWFLGKLQTKQDKDRVMDGLIKDSADSLSKSEIESLLSNMKKRTFLLKSVHLDHLSLFQTRWVLSYLRGPLSMPEIKKLMAEKNKLFNKREAEKEQSTVQEDSTISNKTTSLPLISDKIQQYFLNNAPYNEEIIFEPKILLKGKIRFYSESKGIDEKEEVFLKLPIDENTTEINFEKGMPINDDVSLYDTKSPENAKFYPLPFFIEEMKDFTTIENEFKDSLSRTKKLDLYTTKEFKLLSKPGEDLSSFKGKIIELLRERKEEEVDKLRVKFKGKEESLQKKYNRLLEKLSKEETDTKTITTESVLSIGATVLGAFLGRTKVGNLSSGMTGLRRANRIFKEKKDVSFVKNQIEELTKEIDKLEGELNEKIVEISDKFNVDNYEIETISLQPRKTDISNLSVSLLWESR